MKTSIWLGPPAIWSVVFGVAVSVMLWRNIGTRLLGAFFVGRAGTERRQQPRPVEVERP